MKVKAVRAGVVLSCVTVLAREGLWVRDASTVHVAAPPHSGHVRAGNAVVHWNRPIVPRDPDACEDNLVNALVIAASCLTPEDAVAVWESAMNKQRVTASELSRLPLPAAARAVLEEARPFADSGLETFLPRRLRWMNLPMVQQAWILGKPVDLLIGDRLIIQIDGGHHVGEQRTKDIEFDALLKLNGYHVIRVGYDQVINRWPEVQAMIMAAVAQGLHLAA
ncbi:endonuclease domain-containing protein [Microbacterium sp. KUDC0406]|uniref:endonuclease domain-containing protein n=1 Tax=Microbacterium sp. KUDC0406 TaxID=2909588 RepID=UPI001F23DA6B|nr:DUF559 domain-containing protein [Microbacterium sp. KUDC0406]UJP09682.1 endonuclease domain-containing protein [Microbacterium sp. KUDC0406]